MSFFPILYNSGLPLHICNKLLDVIHEDTIHLMDNYCANNCEPLPKEWYDWFNKAMQQRHEREGYGLTAQSDWDYTLPTLDFGENLSDEDTEPDFFLDLSL